MNASKNSLSGKDILDMYFLENRARLLDIAAFLDRLDRAKEGEKAKSDFRYKAFVRAIKLLLDKGNRAKEIQMSFSDHSQGPIDNALGLKAMGAWEEEIQ